MHAIDRALERYGIKLYYKDINNMIKIITSGKSINSEKVNEFMTFHLIKYKNKLYKVLYKKANNLGLTKKECKQKIVTIYPMDINMLPVNKIKEKVRG